MAELTPEQQAEFITEVMSDWISYANDELDRALAKVEGKIPRETETAVRIELLRQAQPQLQVIFQDSGRIPEMKNVEYSKRAITQDNHFLYEWAKRKGLGKFRHVPGYANKRDGKLSEEQKLLRIANAIAVSKQKGRGRKRRRRRWWNKTIYPAIQELVERLIRDQYDFAQRILKEQINNAYNQ